MSSKLDQSLDTIMTEAGTARRQGRAGRRRGARPAPVGGVRKSVRAAAATANAKNTTKAATKPQATPAAATPGATKVIVSNLPHDVPESDIKEYFNKIAGPVRRVTLTYGPNGQSRGIATIIFVKPSSGAEALKQNGVKVDNRPIKVEAVMDANAAGNPATKSLSDRVSTPNAQPKKAGAEKVKPAKEAAGRAAKTANQARGRQPRGGRQPRPKKKSAAELDAEMTDYFGGNANAQAAAPATNGQAAPAAAPAPAGDDLGMDDIS